MLRDVMDLDLIKTCLDYVTGFVTLYIGTFFLLLYIQNLENIKKPQKRTKSYPSISILIPAYNEEGQIGKAVQSVLDADYPKKEIIVIDDGSTDDTFKITKSFAKYGVKVIKKNHSGKAASLNLGLKHAGGDIIATLDADSFIEKESLKKMISYFDNDEVVAVTSTIKSYEENSVWQKIQKVEYLGMNIFRKLQTFINSVTVTPGPLSMFKAGLFEKIGNFDEDNLVEDQEFALRIQKNDLKIESALDATVYTSTPNSFSELLKQRLRWYRGTLRNLTKYHYLIHPNYGDFGIVMIPTIIFTVLGALAVLFIFLYSIYKAFTSGVALYSLEDVVFFVGPLQLAYLLFFFGTVLFQYFSIKNIKGEFVSLPAIFIYLLFYTPVITFFWLASIFHEVFMRRLRW